MESPARTHDDSRWPKMTYNDPKWPIISKEDLLRQNESNDQNEQTDINDQNIPKMMSNDQKWQEMSQNGLEWLKNTLNRTSQTGWFWRLLLKFIKSGILLGPSTSSWTKMIVVLWFFWKMCNGCPLIDRLVRRRKTQKSQKNAKISFLGSGPEGDEVL